MPEPLLEKDAAAVQLALDELGWVGHKPDDADIVAQREYLAANNGIRGLEVLDPDEVDRAARIFHRDGFVVVRNALSPEQLAFLRDGCDRVIHEVVSMDRNRQGNRGSHRYSFGSASRTGQLLHYPEWAMLVDLPTLTPILSAIFGAPTYMCHGGAGDMCLPGAVEYQRLHSDMGDRIEHDGNHLWSFRDHRGQLTYRDLPVPSVTCNFLMVDFTPINGPIRQIPGTQHSHEPVPTLAEEPEWMKLSTVCPAPAGSVVIRDIRAWHGGTPNLSDHVRAIPNVEFWAPWYREQTRKCMPRKIYDGLSDHGKRVCQYLVADPGEELETGYLDDLGTTPLFMRAGYEDKPIPY